MNMRQTTHSRPHDYIYHYRARAYDPDTGSFLQHDPIPSANPYSYTDNDPVNFTDPLGLSKKGCEWVKYVRVNKTNVCYGVSSDRCSDKCYKELKGSCDTSDAPGGFRLWKDAFYSRCGCSKCEKIASTPSCEEICNGMPSPDCVAQCKENKSRAQDNQGAGKIVDCAEEQLGVPYKLGKEDPNVGFDCSHFVHYCYTQVGMDYEYIQASKPKEEWLERGFEETDRPRPGDVIYFEEGDPHVGIVKDSDGSFIHAESSDSRRKEVREDNWNQYPSKKKKPRDRTFLRLKRKGSL